MCRQNHRQRSRERASRHPAKNESIAAYIPLKRRERKIAADAHISLNTIIVRSTGQASADLGGEAAILNLKNGVYYGLDTVGARIWELIETPHAVRAVRDTLLDEYDVNAERCERDLIDVVDDG
ncbi:MAG: PqqD family peptide modification chaperone [Halobacteriota archaeon]